VSYELLRVHDGAAGNLFMYQTWQQQPAEGITVVVGCRRYRLGGLRQLIPLDGHERHGGQRFRFDSIRRVAVAEPTFTPAIPIPLLTGTPPNDPTTQAYRALIYSRDSVECQRASPEVFATFGGGSGTSSPLQWCDSETILRPYLASEGGGGGPSTCSTFNLRRLA